MRTSCLCCFLFPDLIFGWTAGLHDDLNEPLFQFIPHISAEYKYLGLRGADFHFASRRFFLIVDEVLIAADDFPPQKGAFALLYFIAVSIEDDLLPRSFIVR